jgi:chromosome segregation ATPase
MMDLELIHERETKSQPTRYPGNGRQDHGGHNTYVRIADDAKIGRDRVSSEQDNRQDQQPDLRALQEELFEYRHMMDKLVQERTARLERRIQILKYCNDNLVMRHNKLREMYGELLRKTKSLDANTKT